MIRYCYSSIPFVWRMCQSDDYFVILTGNDFIHLQKMLLLIRQINYLSFWYYPYYLAFQECLRLLTCFYVCYYRPFIDSIYVFISNYLIFHSNGPKFAWIFTITHPQLLKYWSFSTNMIVWCIDPLLRFIWFDLSFWRADLILIPSQKLFN